MLTEEEITRERHRKSQMMT